MQLAGAKRFHKISSKKNNKRRNVSKGENCVLLSYYTTNSGNSLPTFRDNLSVSSSRTKKSSSLKMRHVLSRNVGKELPLLCVINLKRAVLIYCAAEAWNYTCPKVLLRWSELNEIWNNSIRTLEYHVSVFGRFEDLLTNKYSEIGEKFLLQIIQ